MSCCCWRFTLSDIFKWQERCVVFTHGIAVPQTVLGVSFNNSPYVQGGLNMTGTSAACFHTNQSRSYLNHLVSCFSVWHGLSYMCEESLNVIFLGKKIWALKKPYKMYFQIIWTCSGCLKICNNILKPWHGRISFAELAIVVIICTLLFSTFLLSLLHLPVLLLLLIIIIIIIIKIYNSCRCLPTKRLLPTQCSSPYISILYGCCRNEAFLLMSVKCSSTFNCIPFLWCLSEPVGPTCILMFLILM